MMSLETFINVYFNDLVRCAKGNKKQLINYIQDCTLLNNKDKETLVSKIDKAKTIPRYSDCLKKAWRF